LFINTFCVLYSLQAIVSCYMKKIILICLLLTSLCIRAQRLHTIDNAPSNEIYDMLIDHKGFLWIAHSLGISRFDGISFTNFSSVHQSAVGTSGLLEDKYGRIWFYNFNGQVFYIQHEKMEYLKAYDYKNSSNFPPMVIYGDELVVSSLKGLFICNLKTLECHTELVKNDSIKWGPSSLCVVGDKVLAHGSNSVQSVWFYYTPSAGLWEIKGLDPFFSGKPTINFAFNKQALLDTGLIISKNDNLIYGIVFKNNKLGVVFKKQLNAYINTLNIIKNTVWINTRDVSFALNGKDSLKNGDITCILPDDNGSTWYSSLTEGLQFEDKSQVWRRVPLLILPTDDIVKSMLYDGDNLIACSRLGQIISKKSNEKQYSRIGVIPGAFGTVEGIQKAGKDKFFIHASRMLYILDKTQKKLSIADSNSIKSVAIAGKNLLMAASFGLIIKPNTLHTANTTDSFFVTTQFIRPPMSSPRYKELRCRAVLFDSSTKETYASFSSGLVKVKNGVETPVLYNETPLYASSMVMSDGKIYAGTFNNGLFIIGEDSVVKVKNDTESALDAITKIKNCRYHIWLFRTQDIEILDKKTGHIANIYPLPVKAGDVLDAEEDSLNIYLATTKGLFSMPVNASIHENKKSITLINVLINNKDTLLENDNTLQNSENNLLFRLAIPVYNNAGKLHFKYQLTNGDADTAWYYTHDGQRDIQFNALRPGSYALTVIAVKDNEVISDNPLIYRFTIARPWYNTWPFYILVALIIVSITIAIQQYRLRQVLKVERVRRKIASDLHDDIGSTLSSINVYSEIAKKEDDNKEYIATIQQNTLSIINNLDDLVWNINPKNDVLENMIARMRQFAEPLLTEKGIECTFNIDADNLQTAISPDVRTNIYLLFKEAVNNTIKHSNCTVCRISISQKGRLLTLAVADNGKGFDSALINKHRNGLYNMQQRAADINAVLAVSSTLAQGTVVTLTSQLY